MQIDLSKSLSVEDKPQISGSGCLNLPATNIIALGTDIVFPVIFPEEKRTPHIISSYVEKIHQNDIEDKIHWRSKEERSQEKRIQIVDAIEAREFQRRGLYPALPSPVYGELKTFEGMFRIGNIKEWKNKVSDRIYDISVSVENLRASNRPLSGTFPGQTAFSLAVASYSLGCDIATNDYISFNVASLNKFNKAYFERWGSKKRFVRHDTTSLLMLLSKGQ